MDKYAVVDKDVISRTLAVSAAQQVTTEVTKAFVNTVEAASDGVFDQLLYKMENVYYAITGEGGVSPRPGASLEDSSGGSDASEDKEPQPSPGGGPPKKLPPAPPAKNRKPPPALPPKGAKPAPPPAGGRAPSPRAPAPGPASASDIPKVSSNITHMTKDRPLGPAQRRRPQRKPQRRPMMEGHE